VKDVPRELLRPEEAWVANGQSAEKYRDTANKLAGLFQSNFQAFADRCSKSVVDAGPKTA